MCSGTCNTCYQCQDTCNCTLISYVDAPFDKVDASGVIYNMDTNCSTSKLMCFFGIRNGTNLKTILEKLDEKLCQVRGLFDEKVKITVDDASEGYLFDKLIVGNCITKTIVTVEGNQKLQLGIDCNCVKNCIDDAPLSCFIPVFGNPLRICNGSTTTVQINTINTGTSTVQFSTDEGITWVDGTPNTYTFNFTSDGSLQKLKARLKGCNQYADGFVRLCTVVTPTAPVNPPVTPITPTPTAPVAPTPVPTTPVAPTPIFTPVTPTAPTPVTPIAPTPVAPSPTPVAPTAPVGCISVSNFNYTINGNNNANGFTMTGVQDLNIAVTGYTPSGANTPIFYEYVLDGFSSGIISSNTKVFPSVNVGGHVLSITVYNCSGNITKNINFAVSQAVVPTPVAPTPTPITPPVAPSPVCNQITNLEIVGDTTVDPNSTGTFSLSFSGANNITSYSWSISGQGTNVISGANANTATMQFGQSNGTIFLQVVSCGVTVSKSVAFTLNNVPVAPTPVAVTCTNYQVSNDSGNTLNYSFTCCKLNSLIQDTINSGQTKTICAITGSFSSQNGEVTFTPQGSCSQGDECFILSAPTAPTTPPVAPTPVVTPVAPTPVAPVAQVYNLLLCNGSNASFQLVNEGQGYVGGETIYSNTNQTCYTVVGLGNQVYTLITDYQEGVTCGTGLCNPT